MLWFCRLIVLLQFRYFCISAFSGNLLLAGWPVIAQTSSFLDCPDLWEVEPPLFLLWKLKGTEISFAYLLCSQSSQVFPPVILTLVCLQVVCECHSHLCRAVSAKQGGRPDSVRSIVQPRLTLLWVESFLDICFCPSLVFQLSTLKVTRQSEEFLFCLSE